MAWKGFLTESKAYMGYPKAPIFADGTEMAIIWRSKADKRAIGAFWKGFFFWAAPRFYWLCFRDWIRKGAGR